MSVRVSVKYECECECEIKCEDECNLARARVSKKIYKQINI